MEGRSRFIRLPEDVCEKYRLRAENERRRKARYEEKNPKRKHGERGPRPPKLMDRPFCIWDGEGPKDTGYSLFGNSLGMEICYPHLRTRHCLKLIIDAGRQNPYMIHVGFGFTYDVSCMLWELSWRHFSALYKFGRTQWHEYEIEHIPRKWFKVSRGGITVKIYDIQSFFASSLVGALEKWKIEPFASVYSLSVSESSEFVMPSMDAMELMSEFQIVTIFKKLRGEFLYRDISQITSYMRLELKYTKILMESLRQVFLDAGYSPKSWHGPGALAREAFTKHHVYDAMAISPAEVRIAARYAFIGGRFELFQAGHASGPIYCADINSAYPYFCSLLPNLANGNWRRGRGYEPGKFAVYKINYSAKPNSYAIYPLPFRTKSGDVVYPQRVESWFWAPEAELVKDDPNAQFLEAWIFDENSPERPFGFIEDYYHRRRLLKRLGNPAEYTFKLILNSIYGQLAQRTGWDQKNRKAPRTHQLEWAGYITSACRAAIYKQAIQQGDALVSIDTDGIMATKPFTWLEDSKELGGWELTQFDDGIFWQSGMYSLKQGEEWKKAKTRGIPKGTYTVSDLFRCLETFAPLKLTKKVFISYGLALQGQKRQLNKWVEEPHEFQFGGNGKRQHCFRPNECKRHSQEGMHKTSLLTIEFGPFTDPVSKAHTLPWLKEKDEFVQALQDLILYDRNDLDMEDEWIIHEAEKELAW